MINSIVSAFWKEEDGQDMVEYALLLAFVALAGVSVLSAIRTSIASVWTQINSSLTTAATPS
jgi:Flp pilus assembly pilin Flp